jgi:hypothetical protein
VKNVEFGYYRAGKAYRLLGNPARFFFALSSRTGVLTLGLRFDSKREEKEVNWKYEDEEIAVQATEEERERYHKTVKGVGWVHSPAVVESHALGAWMRACKERSLPRLASPGRTPRKVDNP